MSEFPPCRVCPRLPFPNAVWLPTEHMQLRTFTNPLIYPTKQSWKVVIIICYVKREEGEEMVFFSLTYNFTHPYLLHNCFSPPLAEWQGASYLTSVRLASHMQKGATMVPPPRSCCEDDGIPLLSSLSPLPGLLLPLLTLFSWNPTRHLLPGISGQRELVRCRRKGNLSYIREWTARSSGSRAQAHPTGCGPGCLIGISPEGAEFSRGWHKCAAQLPESRAEHSAHCLLPPPPSWVERCAQRFCTGLARTEL